MSDFNTGKAVWQYRHALSQARPRLESIARAIDHLSDSGISQYAQLFATVLAFKPTLIIEIGRGFGNSTAVLTEAAHHLDSTLKVLSFCLTNSWQEYSVKKLAQFVESTWFSNLKPKVQNIFEVDFKKIIKKDDSVLFLWDAHGWDIAEYLLAYLFPLLRHHRHLVLMHDMVDIRYHPELRGYNNAGTWKGYNELQQKPFVIIYQTASAFEEIIPLTDFLTRNNLILHSIEHELHEVIINKKKRDEELKRLLGKSMSSPNSSFHWLSLNEQPDQKKWFFPSFSFKKTHQKNILQYVSRPQRPLVSIVTPCFNRGKFLKECIRSVLMQDYRYVEHIIQDGNSTDNTKQVLKKYYSKRYKGRIYIKSEKDSGQSDGLNKALHRARGEIILVLNADDALMPNACSWGVEQLTKNPSCAVVYGDEYFFDENGEIFTHYTGKYPYTYERLFCVELVPPAQAAFIRRSMFEKVGYYADAALSTCPDFEMWVRIGMKFPMKHEFGVVCKYRHHAGSEGKQLDVIPQMVASKLSVINRTLADHKTPPEIKLLKNRAYAGLYHWGANVARSVGLYKYELLYLIKSLYFRPQLHKIIRLVKLAVEHTIHIIFRN